MHGIVAPPTVNKQNKTKNAMLPLFCEGGEGSTEVRYESTIYFLLLCLYRWWLCCLAWQVDNNTEAFNRAPVSFLERLAELLLTPQQGCDVLAPTVSVSSPEWLEYNCRVMHPSIAGVDAEVRKTTKTK